LQFGSVRDKHPATDVGVFFCGVRRRTLALLTLQPQALGHALHVNCNQYSGIDETTTRFMYGKGARANPRRR